FQIQDDLLPYTSDESTLGKSVTSDLANRRLTLPLILAYDNASPAGWARLDRARSAAITAEQAHADVAALLVETNGCAPMWTSSPAANHDAHAERQAAIRAACGATATRRDAGGRVAARPAPQGRTATARTPTAPRACRSRTRPSPWAPIAARRPIRE